MHDNTRQKHFLVTIYNLYVIICFITLRVDNVSLTTLSLLFQFSTISITYFTFHSLVIYHTINKESQSIHQWITTSDCTTDYSIDTAPSRSISSPGYLLAHSSPVFSGIPDGRSFSPAVLTLFRSAAGHTWASEVHFLMCMPSALNSFKLPLRNICFEWMCKFILNDS